MNRWQVSELMGGQAFASEGGPGGQVTRGWVLIHPNIETETKLYNIASVLSCVKWRYFTSSHSYEE